MRLLRSVGVTLGLRKLLLVRSGLGAPGAPRFLGPWSRLCPGVRWSSWIALRWPGSQNIWLTGCRRLHLPVAGGHPATGHLLISLHRRLGTTGQNQTVWNVDLPEAGLSGMVTFAFQFPEIPDGA